MTTRKHDRRIAQEPHYLRLEKLTADRRVNDRRGPVDAIREKLAQQLQEQLALNAELVDALIEIDRSAKSFPQCGVTCGEIARAVLAKVKP